MTSGRVKRVLPYFMDNWEKRRIEEGIIFKLIFNDTKQGRIRGSQLCKLKYIEIRYLPKELVSPADFYIYSNKVGLNLWSEDMPLSIIIENKEIADSFRSFFEWFWKISKK